MDFTPVEEWIWCLRLGSRFFNMTLNYTYAPSEQKHETENKCFYDKLDSVYQKASMYDIKIIMGDVNAKLENNVRICNAGRHSLHEESNNNGMRLIRLVNK